MEKSEGWDLDLRLRHMKVYEIQQVTVKVSRSVFISKYVSLSDSE